MVVGLVEPRSAQSLGNMLIYQSVRKIPAVLSINGTTSVKLILPSVVRGLFYWVDSANQTRRSSKPPLTRETIGGRDEGRKNL